MYLKRRAATTLDARREIQQRDHLAIVQLAPQLQQAVHTLLRRQGAEGASEYPTRHARSHMET